MGYQLRMLPKDAYLISHISQRSEIGDVREALGGGRGDQGGCDDKLHALLLSFENWQIVV